MLPRSVSLMVLSGLIACLGLAFLKVVQPFLLTLLLAGVMAMLLQPALRYFMAKTGGRRTWAAGLDWQKDTWHIPEFFELLVEGQEQYDLAITGKQDAKTTMDNIAAFEEKLLKETGHIK